jgi:alkylation response protein AidB-like acyl-CoA dehydrogenase
MEAANANAVDLETFGREVAAWVAEADVPTVPHDVDERFEVLRAWQKTLYEAGWVGVDWPAEFGGRGLSLLHQAEVMRRLIAADAPLPVAIVNLVVAGPTLIGFATDEQRERHLPTMLAAEEIWCQGFSEPDSGSDLASLRTSARDDGDDFIVNGQKVWTSYAHRADFCALLARTDKEAPPHKGISFLIVDMRTPGITVRPLGQITGDAEFSEVFFEDVRVPKENLVGPLHGGWGVAMHSLSSERSRILIQRHAGADAALGKAIAHLRASGATLSPDVKRRIGRAQAQLAALEGQVRKTVARVQGKAPPGPVDSVDKLVLTEVEQDVYGLIYDLLGPYRLVGGSEPLGLESERWIHDYFYARSWSISGGTLQIQRNIVAERLLGLPRT